MRNPVRMFGRLWGTEDSRDLCPDAATLRAEMPVGCTETLHLVGAQSGEKGTQWGL